MRAIVAVAAVLALVVAAGCGGAEVVQAAPETVEGTTPTQTQPTTTETTNTTETTGTTENTNTTETTGTTTDSGGEGNATAGKQVFLTAGCASCHTLSDAGSNGTIGPNLDDAKPSYDLALDRVTNGMGAMPPFKGQLSEQQIKDVAAYVSSVAGK